MSSSTYHETIVNALLCYVVLGGAGESKRGFTKIMFLPLNQVGEEEGNFTSEINNFKGGEICFDLLKDELLRRNKAN